MTDMHEISPNEVRQSLLKPINDGIDGELSINGDGDVEFFLDQEMVQQYADDPQGFWFTLSEDDVNLLGAAMRLP